MDLLDRSRLRLDARAPVGAAARAALAAHAAPPAWSDAAAATPMPRRRRPPRPKDVTSSAAARRKAAQVAYAAAWRDAFAPVRGLLTAWLMLWMAGSAVQVFSVMSVVTVLVMQVQGLLGVRKKFAKAVRKNADLEGRLMPQVVVCTVLCCGGVAMALWKCHMLGFLPTEESDWIALLPVEHLEDTVRGGMHF